MTIVSSINELTFDFDKWDNETKQFVDTDGMQFVRKVLLEKLLDGTYFLHYGKSGNSSESYASMKKDDVKKARRSYTGDEISANALRGAIAESKSASHKHEQLAELYADLQAQYFQEFGDYYKPWGSGDYYYGTQNIVASNEMPEDIRQELEAMGALDEAANEYIETPTKKKA